MNAFIDYLDQARLTQVENELDIIRHDEEYRIYHGIVPLMTPRGKEFIHPSERVARLIITSLIGSGGRNDHGFSAAWLYAFQRDIFETTGDPFPAEWQELLRSDPFFAIKTTGKFNFRTCSPDEPLFSFTIITLSSLISAINEFVNSAMGEVIVGDSEAQPFPELVRLSYDRLSAGRKVVVQALSGLHDSAIVLPLMLVMETISPLEYAKGLVALKIRDEKQLQGILVDLAHAMDYLECLESRSVSGRRAGAVIREGENDTVEFKSTLRWDIRAGRTNPAVERACLKTIAAFLNSGGGILLIGVRDDGSIEGIESDKFANEDKFLLHLWTLIRTCLGRDVSPYIRTTIEKLEDRSVCLVHCRQSSRPAFLRQPGFDEAFYIRVGPSSNAMDISEALKYIADHFGEK